MTRNTDPKDHRTSSDGNGQGKRNPGGNKPSADDENGGGKTNKKDS